MEQKKFEGLKLDLATQIVLIIWKIKSRKQLLNN